VYGPRDRSLNRLLGMSKYLPFLPLFGDGRQAMQPLFIDDLARVVADACLSPACADQLFELGGPEVMTMNEVLRTALEVMGRRRPILHAPMFLGRAAGRLAQLLPTPPLTADALDFISRPAVADNGAVMRLLDPRLTPLREGLRTYLGRKRRRRHRAWTSDVPPSRRQRALARLPARGGRRHRSEKSGTMSPESFDKRPSQAKDRGNFRH